MLKLPGAVVSGSVIYLTTEVCGKGQPRDVGNYSIFFSFSLKQIHNRTALLKYIFKNTA